MENKNIRRYLAWFLIGVSIIIIGVLGNALIGDDEPAGDQNLIQKQGPDGNIEQTDGENPESTRNLIYARSSHTATTLADGRILVVGGLGSDKKPMSKVEIYDPKTDTWTAINDCRSPRADHTTTVLKNGNVLVVGGGDSAMEEALFLTKFASEVHIIHRRDVLRASKIMQERVMRSDKINIVWNSTIKEILGSVESGVNGVLLKDTQNGNISNFNCDGVFLAIGHNPNVSLFEKFLDLDKHGYILTKGKTTETNIPGVFVCGDVQDSRYKQAITAAGSGCKAAIDAERFLETHPLL